MLFFQTYFPARAGAGNLLGLASGVIRFPLFLTVQNRLFCCLIVQTDVSYHIIVCIILIMNTLVCSKNRFTVYCTLLFFSFFSYSG